MGGGAMPRPTREGCARPSGLQRGRQALEQRDLRTALAELRLAVKEEPKSAAAHAALGVALGQSGDASSAAGEFRRSLDLDPQQAGVYLGLAGALELLHDGDGAVAAYQQALRLRPDWPESGVR